MSDTRSLHDRFDAVSFHEYIKFERVENRRSNRPDLHAFLLLDELCPSNRDRDMVCAAEHDEIWLDVDVNSFVLTDDQIIELTRCGVRYDPECECLVMFA